MSSKQTINLRKQAFEEAMLILRFVSEVPWFYPKTAIKKLEPFANQSTGDQNIFRHSQNLSFDIWISQRISQFCNPFESICKKRKLMYTDIHPIQMNRLSEDSKKDRVYSLQAWSHTLYLHNHVNVTGQ